MVGSKSTQKKHRPPARLKYEGSHPTVSFRLERSRNDELRAILGQRRMSLADLVKEAMGAQKAIIAECEEARSEGYKRGYEKGKLEGQRAADRALHNERTKLREEKETAVRQARDDGYKEGLEKGSLEEREHRQKTLNDEMARLKAEMEEAVKKAEDKGHRQGFLEGHAQAKQTYLVSYECPFCGEPIEVTTADEKAAIRQFAKECGWAHESCSARAEQRRQAEEAERLREEDRRREFEARYGTRAAERGFGSDIEQV